MEKGQGQKKKEKPSEGRPLARREALARRASKAKKPTCQLAGGSQAGYVGLGSDTSSSTQPSPSQAKEWEGQDKGRLTSNQPLQQGQKVKLADKKKSFVPGLAQCLSNPKWI